MGATKNQALTIQRRSLKEMRNMKNSILEEPLIHLSIYDVMNEEDDEAKGSRRSLPMKRIKDKYSFHDIVWLCIRLYSVDVLCMIECLH